MYPIQGNWLRESYRESLGRCNFKEVVFLRQSVRKQRPRFPQTLIVLCSSGEASYYTEESKNMLVSLVKTFKIESGPRNGRRHPSC